MQFIIPSNYNCFSYAKGILFEVRLSRPFLLPTTANTVIIRRRKSNAHLVISLNSYSYVRIHILSEGHKILFLLINIPCILADLFLYIFPRSYLWCYSFGFQLIQVMLLLSLLLPLLLPRTPPLLQLLLLIFSKFVYVCPEWDTLLIFWKFSYGTWIEKLGGCSQCNTHSTLKATSVKKGR